MQFSESIRQSKQLSDLLNAQIQELSTHMSQKDIEITKAKIEASNLYAIKQQLTSSLDLVRAEFNSMKTKVEKQPVQILSKDSLPDSNELKVLKTLLVAQQADHSKELSKRDQLITKLQDLFKEVEAKQSAKEQEMESRVREVTQKHANFISKLKVKLAETEETNKELSVENMNLQE